MNREAVALGTPVFTTFEGRLGAVDEALLREGRLRKLDDPEQIVVERRPAERRVARPPRPARTRQTAALAQRTMRSLHSSVNARRVGQVGVDAVPARARLLPGVRPALRRRHPERYEDLLADTIVLRVAMKLVIFALFGLYSKLWRFVDQKDFEAILKAVVVSSVGLIVGAVPVLDRQARPAALA